MRLALRALGVGLLLVAACDDGGLSFCTDRDDAGNCPELPPFDAGPKMDATTTPPSDSSTPDAFVPGADAAVADATVGMDASVDAAAPALTVEDYCAAQYAVAVAWRNKLEQCCASSSTSSVERSDFLFGALLYEDGSDLSVGESVGNCVTGIQSTLARNNLTFVGSAAAACATKFASQFTAPDAPGAACPVAGFALQTREAEIGHGAQSITQLSECRAAFVGKIALNGVCSNSFECASGLRCLTTGGGKTCRDPLVAGNACTQTSECADGLVCQGGAGAGRVCRSAAEPVEVSSACSITSECRTSLICGEAGTCVNPAATLYCAQ